MSCLAGLGEDDPQNQLFCTLAGYDGTTVHARTSHFERVSERALLAGRRRCAHRRILTRTDAKIACDPFYDPATGSPVSVKRESHAGT